MSRKQEAMSAVRANPKSSKAWSNLGDVLAAEGQLEKAKESYLRAIQLDPSNEAAQEGMLSASMAQAQQAQEALPPEPPPQRVTPPPARETPPSPPRGGAKVADSVPKEEPRTAPRAATPPPAASSAAAGGKTAIKLRKRPPQVQKPGQGRIIAGIVALLILPTLCLCAVLFYALSAAFGG